MHKNRITIVILLICLLLCVVGCQYNNTSQEIHPKDRNILYGDSETPLDINTESDMKFYLKASILHEFMDDADIITTFYGPNFNTLKTKGDSDGTWGAVGVGFSGRLQPDQFFFIDAETYFGNDFDDTFSVRAGLALEF